ncbi:MAG TPA: alpha-amylase family glycosyl hydrolase, partial [Blastocatellia bacterium]|nr:alpha-amylase family glycosyl hydrolase [Blastocatellia bacterium]
GGNNSLLVLGGDTGVPGTVALGPYTGPDATTPDWAKRAVWYQIFPERFRNGDPRNDPPGTVPWRQEWFGRAPGETGDFYHYIFDRRYGGDFQGVLDKLDYIQSLGVTAIYFNPVFEAPSLHKYDTEDYRHVDDNFGFKGDIAKLHGETEDPATWQWTASDKLFLKLVAECHRRGIKVIVDGVFNHTGSTFWAFKDVLKNGKDSKYAGWYKIKSFGPPVEYEGWFGVSTLPEIKQTPNGLNEGFTRHIYAVTKRWMDPNGDGNPSDGIDGWRLDVPNLVPLDFWVEWRKLVKGINQDAYIVGEIWDPVPQMLDGRSFDAQMNYPVLRAVVRFFIDTAPRAKPSEFVKELDELRSLYPRSVTFDQQNLLDSHDTDRIASAIVNPNRKFDAGNRLQDKDGANYDTRKPAAWAYDRLRLITIFQMTYVGAPMIWYGDEVGMWGADDPTDRKAMLWKDLEPYQDPAESVDGALLAHYRKLIAIRNSTEALQIGEYKTLVADDDHEVLAFERTANGKRVIVVINNSDRIQQVRIPASGMFHDALNDPRYTITNGRIAFSRAGDYTTTANDGTLTVTVGPGWGAILIAQ